MSLSIDIGKFSSWSEIFKELEKREKSKESERVKEGRARFYSVRVRESTTRNKIGRLVSEGGAISQPKCVQNLSFSRQTSLPCFSGTFDVAKVRADPRLTDAAAKLSQEELALLYEDILKPLDFYSILHERRKQSPETKT